MCGGSDVIPNRAEGTVRDLTSAGSFPADNGIVRAARIVTTPAGDYAPLLAS